MVRIPKIKLLLPEYWESLLKHLVVVNQPYRNAQKEKNEIYLFIKNKKSRYFSIISYLLSLPDSKQINMKGSLITFQWIFYRLILQFLSHFDKYILF